MTDKPQWELEEPARRECYALYRECGVATVWTTHCSITVAGEAWIEWTWDVTVLQFEASGVARSQEEAEALAERMFDALEAMASQYDAPREYDQHGAALAVDWGDVPTPVVTLWNKTDEPVEVSVITKPLKQGPT